MVILRYLTCYHICPHAPVVHNNKLILSPCKPGLPGYHMPLSVPCSPASPVGCCSLPGSVWGGRNGDFPKATSGTFHLAPSPFQTSVFCLATCPDPHCSAAASLAILHSIIPCLSPPSKCVLRTPLYWISVYWSQIIFPICKDHFDFQPYKVLANCASPPGKAHRF